MPLDSRIRTTRLVRIEHEASDTKTFYFKDPELDPGKFVMGQCYMVWVPRVGEAPLGISGLDKDGMASVTVQKKGTVTAAMHAMKAGDLIGLKGPFGNGFNIPTGLGSLVVVAGGIGAAPFGPLDAGMAEKVTVILGAKSHRDVLFEKRFSDLDIDVRISTDDGTCGFKGFATNCFEENADDCAPDLVLTCGPEAMMKCVVDFCMRNGIPVQASLERHMKCGMGICDACSVSGYQVCKDGPVFTGGQLSGMPEFGRYKRTPAGTRVPL